MTGQARVGAGVPQGGEFASRQRDDADVTLHRNGPTLAPQALRTIADIAGVGRPLSVHYAYERPPFGKKTTTVVSIYGAGTWVNADLALALVDSGELAITKHTGTFGREESLIAPTARGLSAISGWLPETVNPRHRALAELLPSGLRADEDAEGRVRVDTYDQTAYTRLPTPAQVASFLSAGFVEFHVGGPSPHRGTLVLTDAGRQLLAHDTPELVADILVQYEARQQHRYKTTAYRSGGSARKNGGGSYVQRLSCSCGWSAQINGSRADALAAGALHQRREADKIIASSIFGGRAGGSAA